MSSGEADGGNGADVADAVDGVVLTPRLAAVAALVPAGGVVADIGTDHAALPIALVRAGRAPRAIASEVARGPFDYAKRTVAEAGCASLVDVRFGSGLGVLKPGEAACIVLAGMGAWTILDIIETGLDVARAAAALVVQPQTEPGLVRRALVHKGFALLHERLAREGERFYVVMAYRWEGHPRDRKGGVVPAMPGLSSPPPHALATEAAQAARVKVPEGLLWDIGPGLVAARDPLLGPFLRHLAAIEEQNLTHQGHGSTDRARAAHYRTAERLAALRRLLAETEGSV